MAYQNCGMTHTYLHQYDNSDQLVSYEIKLLHTVNNMTILKENSNISSTFVLSPRLKMDLSPYLLIWIHHPLMCSILCDRAAQDLFTAVRVEIWSSRPLMHGQLWRNRSTILPSGCGAKGTLCLTL